MSTSIQRWDSPEAASNADQLCIVTAEQWALAQRGAGRAVLAEWRAGASGDGGARDAWSDGSKRRMVP
jgi:hypothetical protein